MLKDSKVFWCFHGGTKREHWPGMNLRTPDSSPRKKILTSCYFLPYKLHL